MLTVALFGTMVADGPHVVLGTPYHVPALLPFGLGTALGDRVGQSPSSGGIGWGDGPVFGVGLALFSRREWPT